MLPPGDGSGVYASGLPRQGERSSKVQPCKKRKQTYIHIYIYTHARTHTVSLVLVRRALEALGIGRREPN